VGDKTIRRKVEAEYRKQIAGKKVVSLNEFRDLNREIELGTILVVDDEEIQRNGLKRILTSEGFQVVLASDGLELAKHIENTRFDLILLDVNLPWVDGYELCRMIKSHPSTAKVPVVFVSARQSKEDMDKAFSVGAADFISKPYDVSSMVASVSKFVKVADVFA
jgi:two-component system aerobic respiration control protein ArcA